jgi:hypothetical protein
MSFTVTVVTSPFLKMGDLLKSLMVKVSSSTFKQLTVKSLSAIMINWKLSFPNNMMNWKYNEETLLNEVRDYIGSTYNQHYSAGDNKIQTLDLIESVGDAEPFTRSNAIKYLSRYDKKGTARADIMKAIHYCVLLLHFSDKSKTVEEYPNR